jgi:hypothetical protein
MTSAPPLAARFALASLVEFDEVGMHLPLSCPDPQRKTSDDYR